MKAQELSDFEAYHAAVGADRYRVTSVKFKPDGGKIAFVLDKRDGKTIGFTPAEMAEHVDEMRRLQQRGENLYYTPLSDEKHHILIDDMNQPKLDKLLADGYKPAVVVESSPENYQAIITLPVLGNAHDKHVVNRLSERLNREYGDPALSGAVHPHRAPGYENRKARHRRPDGSYPAVRIVSAEKRECDKCMALAQEIEADHLQRIAAPKPKQVRVDKSLVATASNLGGVHADVYRRHYKHITETMKIAVDNANQIDSMIAVRMCVTGFPQEVIETTIRACAPSIRSLEKAASHNWDDYASRTAGYPFATPKGRQQVEGFSKYQQAWLKVEGRQPVAAKSKAEKKEPQKLRGVNCA